MTARHFVVALLLAGCGDDPANADAAGSDATTASASSSTGLPTGVDTTAATGGPSSGTDTGPGGTSDTGLASTSTGGTDSSGSGGTDSSGSGDSSGSTGAEGIGPYGDCVGEMMACPDLGLCVLVPATGVCAPPCVDVADCPPPPAGGTAPVVCGDANDNGAGDCLLDCAGGDPCPTGMTCFADQICVWT